MPECEGLVTIMRNPVGIKGISALFRQEQWPQDSAAAPSLTLHKALHLPNPLLVCSQSSLQPQGVQTHYNLELSQPYRAWFWVLEPHNEER